MTEYEAASLAIQKASLAAQQASVWVAALVGAAQCSLIAYGLYFMRQAARHRDAQHRETMKALDSRHREHMEALAAEREAQKDQHRATMEALAAQREDQKDQHRATMNAMERTHRENMEALKELIRRTAAPPDTPHPE